MQHPLTLAKQNLENSAKTAEDEFLLNVSAQLARESLQQNSHVIFQ
jgi:hypothetical protein